MGVESAASIGSFVSLGPALGGLRGGLGPGIPGFASEGPARGFSSLAGLGAKLEAPLESFVNEGPVNGSFLENTILSQAYQKPAGTEVPAIFQSGLADIILDPAIKNPVPQLGVLNKSAISPLPEMKQVIETVEHIPFPVIQPAVKPAVDIFPAPLTQTDEAVVVKVNTQPQVETREVSQLSQPVVAPVLQEREVEGVIEEERLVHQPTSRIEEEVVEDERVYLEDEPVSEQRRVEVRQAIDKAKPEAEKLGLKKIPGWLVAKLMPAEHPGNRSQIVKKKGPDGSYQETVEAIAAVGELESEQQAQDRFNNIIAEKSPVKLGKQGRRVGYEVVARVFKYLLFKVAADEIIQKRIVKKTVQTFGQNQLPTVETPKIRTESTIEDNPDLAAVFNSGLTD